jgi:hypothetical protein
MARLAASERGKSSPRQCANFQHGFARLCVTENAYAGKSDVPSDPRGPRRAVQEFRAEKIRSRTGTTAHLRMVDSPFNSTACDNFTILFSSANRTHARAFDEKAANVFFSHARIVKRVHLYRAAALDTRVFFSLLPHHFALLPDGRRRR